MRRTIRIAVALTAAASVMALCTSIAAATGSRVAISSGSVASLTGVMTLSGSAVGVVARAVTLNVSNIPSSADCANADFNGLVSIGQIRRGSATVLSPATVTATLLFGTSWTLNLLCSPWGDIELIAGSPVIVVLNVQFQIRVNAITQPLYTGSFAAYLNSFGSILTVNSSSLRAAPGGSAGLLIGSPSVFPGISYTII